MKKTNKENLHKENQSKQTCVRSDSNKSVITKPVIQAAIILASFYAIEIVWVYCDLFPDYTTLLIADIILRFVLGAIALVILNGYAKRGESKFTVKKLFTNKIRLRHGWFLYHLSSTFFCRS